MTVAGKFYNRAWAAVAAAPGLGNAALGGAAFPNFLSFSDAGVLDQDPLTVLFQDGNNVELSECVYTAAGASLARNTVRFSISGGVKGTAKLNLSAAVTCSIVEGAEDQVSIATGSSAAIPAMDGTGAPGSSALYSRADHVHPSDTSRAALASPAFTGTPTAPTAAAGTNNTQVATTAFVKTAITNLPIAFVFAGKPASSALVNVPITISTTIPASLTGSITFVTTTATASTIFTLNKISGGTTTALGTVTITPLSATGRTLAGAGGALLPGDCLQMVAPSTADSTLADLGITILAQRT